jgi:TonB family protein
MPGPITPFSLRWSFFLHGLVLLCAIVIPLLPAFRKQPLDVVEFTVVLEENLIEPAKQPDKKPPEKIKDPEDPIEPIKPNKLPDPINDAVVLEPKKPKDPVKPKDPKPKEVEKPKDPVKPKEFKKGERVTKPIDKPQIDFTKLKKVTDKKLTSKEIADALAAGAKIGTRNQIPADEVSRCVSLVRSALYNAWEQPGASEAGSRPAKLLIRLDANGKIASYRIIQSSGSSLFDSTVLRAAATCEPIRGLTVAFLNEHDELTIEFKLE